MPDLVDRIYGGVCSSASCPSCLSSSSVKYVDTFNCTEIDNNDTDNLIEKYGILAGSGILVIVFLVLALFCCACCRAKK